jgi:hypothetical protein
MAAYIPKNMYGELEKGTKVPGRLKLNYRDVLKGDSLQTLTSKLGNSLQWTAQHGGRLCMLEYPPLRQRELRYRLRKHRGEKTRNHQLDRMLQNIDAKAVPGTTTIKWDCSATAEHVKNSQTQNREPMSLETRSN